MALLTIEQYERMFDELDAPTELVGGRVVTLGFPKPEHGYVCGNAVHLLGSHLDRNDAGWLIGGRSGVITHRNPDTLRGADVSFYSYARLPRGSRLDRYLSVSPNLILEVRDTDECWNSMGEKVVEYLNAGVAVVVVLDPETETAHVYRADQPELKLNADEELTFPDVLPGFAVKVKKFFE